MHSKCTINFLNDWKNSNKQSNIEKEKQNWKNQTPWLQIILQSYSNQNNMILAQKKEVYIQLNGAVYKAQK